MFFMQHERAAPLPTVLGLGLESQSESWSDVLKKIKYQKRKL